MPAHSTSSSEASKRSPAQHPLFTWMQCPDPKDYTRMVDQVCSENTGTVTEEPRKRLFVWLDCEATGLERYNDVITQVAAIATDENSHVIGAFQSNMKPTKTICAKAVEVTGLTNESLANAPRPRKVLQRFVRWHEKLLATFPAAGVVWVAHNGMQYDFPLLFSEFWRWNLLPAYLMKKIRFEGFFDTLTFCKKFLPTTKLHRNERGRPCYRLGKLYEACVQKEVVNAHDAMADTLMMVRICQTPVARGLFDQFWNLHDGTVQRAVERWTSLGTKERATVMECLEVTEFQKGRIFKASPVFFNEFVVARNDVDKKERRKVKSGIQKKRYQKRSFATMFGQMQSKAGGPPNKKTRA